MTNVSMMYNVSMNLSGSSDMPYLEYINTAMLFLIMISGIIGNTVVILVQFRNKRKSTTDFFVITMAIFDLFSCLIILPLLIVDFRKRTLPIDVLSAFCKIENYGIYTSAIGTSVLLSGTAVDRYYKISKPHSNAISPIRTRTFCIAVSVVTSVAFTPILYWMKYDGIKEGCGYVGDLWDVVSVMRKILATGFGLLIVTTVFSYTMVARTIRKRRKIQPCNASSVMNNLYKQDEKAYVRKFPKITFAFLMIISVFVMTWIISVVGLAIPIQSGFPLTVKRMLSVCHVINYVTNPLFYMWLHSMFRERVRQLVFLCWNGRKNIRM
ncbi:hypothetical protein DPMN_021171 [Dreissena polymorpha]|uniref:G-protein coupled receptors family 1 profile domain-containing protein n=1 Tax=Dreissena polymorpha TaxID=45954 RepID=A0A9D4SBL1_DREPO|nr:hypothetical protein DPMN_021171 [Dreissena polymorpha]